MANAQVLIVDDDLFARMFLRQCLSGVDCDVTEAADGEQALIMLGKKAPELVLLDLFMPKKSGLQVLSELRAQGVSCPVWVISSMDTQSLVDQALKAGANGFIAKPFHPVEVAAAVSQALGGRQVNADE